MIYQKMLMGDKPYFISVNEAKPFEAHRHPEIEISFCIEGGYDIICEHKRYSLKAGDFAVILPMVSHEIPENNTRCKQLTVEVGSVMLGEYFEYFTSQSDACLIYRESDKLTELFKETATLYRSEQIFRELLIKGNLYKICALLMQLPNFQKADSAQNKKMTDIKKIDRALEKIYNYYYEPLSVESVSAYCGYSKSNFCKIFKSVTGNTFHSTLNRHRVEVACMMLVDSDRSVEEIARETGFADTKSFCRVFKGFMGTNAGEYRKKRK